MMAENPFVASQGTGSGHLLEYPKGFNEIESADIDMQFVGTCSKVNLTCLFQCTYQVLKANSSASDLPVVMGLNKQPQDVVAFCQENAYGIVSEIGAAIDKCLLQALGKDINAAGLYGLAFVRCGEFEDAAFITFVKNNQLVIKYLVSFKLGMASSFADVLNMKLHKLGVSDSCRLVAATVDRDCFHMEEIEALLSAKKDRTNALLEFHCVIYKLESVLGHALQKSMLDDPQVAIIANLCNMLKNLALADDLNLGDAMFQGPESSTSTFFNYKTLVTLHNHWLDIVTKLNKVLVDSLVEDDRQVISFILATLKSTTFIVNLVFYIELFRSLHEWTSRVVVLGIPAYQVLNELQGASSTLRHHTATGGVRVEELLEELRQSCGRYRGVDISCDLDEALFTATMNKVCSLMAEILDDIVRQTSPSISKFSILDPKVWPVDSCQLDDFGFDSIKALAREYRYSLLDNVDVFQEWGSYKRTVHNSFVTQLRDNFDALAVRMVSSFKSLYPGIVTLLSAATLLCPASNVLQKCTQLLLEGEQSEEVRNIQINGPPVGSWSAAAALSFLLQERCVEQTAQFSDKACDLVLPLEAVRSLFVNTV
ncbi:uncharacterized protein LOC142559450 [Dermacentor variabilis]|uniref:uncharacterized protein LOC142559450 n=1 Tax=Dermacentor variabilis TaxID=34621 RepID=UPI003F5B1682